MPSMKQDMLRCLEEYRLFGRGRSKRLFNEHSDILVKHDNLEAKFVKTIWLSKHPEKFGSHAFLAFFPRICTICEVTFRDSGRQVRVFNAHFDHISGFARKTGLDMILRYMDQLQQEKPMPMVLMGDFNVRPSNKLISRLRGNLHQYSNIRLVDAYAYANGQAERLNTYHGFKGNHFGKARLDYIFVTDDLEVVNTYVDHTVKDGDIFPIIIRLSQPCNLRNRRKKRTLPSALFLYIGVSLKKQDSKAKFVANQGRINIEKARESGYGSNDQTNCRNGGSFPGDGRPGAESPQRCKKGSCRADSADCGGFKLPSECSCKGAGELQAPFCHGRFN